MTAESDRLAADTPAEAWLGGWVAAWIAGCMRHSRIVISISLIGALLLIPQLIGRLGVNSDTTDMIDPSVDWQRRFVEFSELFPQFDDLLVVVIDGDTPIRARSAANELAAALDGDADFASVYYPGGGTFYDQQGLLFLSVDDLETLLDRVSGLQPFLSRSAGGKDPAALIEFLAEVIERAPEPDTATLRQLLREIEATLAASQQGQRQPVPWSTLEGATPPYREVLLLQARQDFAAWRPGQRSMDTVRRTAEALELTSARGVQVRLTGPVALQTEELDTAARSVAQTLWLALIMVAAVLYLTLRSVRLVAATVATLLIGLLYTAGFAAFAIGHLNLISVAFAVLYIGLGVDFGIHFCLRFRELLTGDRSPEEAAQLAATDVGASLVLCAVTTSIGFFAFVPTEFSGVSELGLISGTGMYVSLVVTLSLLPALLKHLPQIDAMRTRPRTGAATLLGGWVQSHGRGILGVAFLLGLASLLAVPQARFDSNPVNLRSPDTESVAAYRDLLTDPSRSPMNLSVIAPTATAAEQLGRRLEALEEVSEVHSLASMVARDQDDKLWLIDELALLVGPLGSSPETIDPADSMKSALRRLAEAVQHHGDSWPPDWRPDLQRLADSARQASESLSDDDADRLGRDLLLELDQQLIRLRQGLAASPFDQKDLPESIRVRWMTEDGRYRLQVQPNAELSRVESMDPFVHAVLDVAPEATGLPIVNLFGGHTVVGAFQQAFLSALVAVSLLLVVLLRRAMDVVLVLLPLLLATPVIVAATVVLGIDFNYANVITLPLLLGIGVDNGIHMVHRARHARPQDGNLLASSTARAVVFSAITTIVSFGNLAFAPHLGMASMGLVLTIGMLAQLLATVVVLPALIHRWIPIQDPPNSIE